MLWLPLYFCYSIEAKRVESKRTGSDRSFTGLFTCVLKFLQHFKESKKRKQKVEREEYSENKEVGNIEKMIFVTFDIELKL